MKISQHNWNACVFTIRTAGLRIEKWVNRQNSSFPDLIRTSFSSISPLIFSYVSVKEKKKNPNRRFANISDPQERDLFFPRMGGRKQVHSILNTFERLSTFGSFRRNEMKEKMLLSFRVRLLWFLDRCRFLLWFGNFRQPGFNLVFKLVF